MAAVNKLANETSKVRNLVGTEASYGAGGTPTFQLLGNLAINEREPLITRDEYTGGLDPLVTPEKGPYDVDGTYEELLTFETFAILPRYGMNRDGVTGTSDSQSTPGYTRTYTPCDEIDDIDSMVVEHGPPGLVEKATGVRLRQWTISGDADDAEGSWKLTAALSVQDNGEKTATVSGTQTATGGSTTTVVKAAAGWTVDGLIGAYVFIRTGAAAGDVRRIVDNDATTLTVSPAFVAAVANADTFEISNQFTAGIAVPEYEHIKSAGTLHYFDDDSADIGTTQLKNKVISWSVTHLLETNPKRFSENERGYSDKVGTGWRRVSGQVRIEFDDFAEYRNWKNTQSRAWRIKREGSVIDSGANTHKLAQIDLFRLYWNEITRDTRQSNLTRTFAFLAFLDVDESSVMELTGKTTLATLP